MKYFHTAILLASVALIGCSSAYPPVDGHASNKEASASNLIIQYGCPTCHVIPSVPGAVGTVGPSLKDLAQRSYLAGTLENSPENLVRWIQHPQQIHPGTAMPEMGVTVSDAQTIAAFLQQRQ